MRFSSHKITTPKESLLWAITNSTTHKTASLKCLFLNANNLMELTKTRAAERYLVFLLIAICKITTIVFLATFSENDLNTFQTVWFLCVSILVQFLQVLLKAFPSRFCSFYFHLVNRNVIFVKILYLNTNFKLFFHTFF